MSEFEAILDSDEVMEFDATLAAWLGLNEAIILEQVGVEIQKQSREDDSAILHLADFMNLFPFWDRNIIKRAIQNLQQDGILLTQADQKNWYSIDYDALDQLTGPVERVKSKVAKRRKARDSRLLDHRPGYVYLCRTIGNQGYKIGSSLNVATRMAQLEATPIISFPADDMAAAELALHQRYNAKRLSGEYFALNSEDKAFIASILEYRDGNFFQDITK